MSSNINQNNIDGTYPIAGQDNDSQGFRTNFTNIKTNLGYAKEEIEDLQGKAILKSALDGTTLDNNMGGAVLNAAEIKDFRETRVDFGTDSGTLELNHSDAHNFTVSTNGSVSLSFTGFPAAGKVGRIRFEIAVNNVAHTLTLPSAVSVGTAGISGIDTATNVITFAETGVFMFEFWSDDGGTAIHMWEYTRPKTEFSSTEIKLLQRTPTNTGQTGDVAGMMALDSNYFYICTATYDGSTAIWKRASFSSY